MTRTAAKSRGPARLPDTPPADDVPRGTDQRVLVLLIGVVLALVLATHWPALSAQALSFDDEQYLTKNPLVQHPSWSAAWRFTNEVTKPSTVEGYYQPLAMISLMLDTAMGGRTDYLRPYHRTSLGLHLANTGLIIIFLYLLFRQPWVAAAVGLLYGVHPLTVEPIPWVGERKTLLASFFALIALVTYVRYARVSRKSEIRNRKWYVFCLGGYVLSLLSKPTTTPVAVLLLLLDYWPLRRLSKSAILEKIPFFVIAGISSIITILSQGHTAGVVMPSEYSSPLRIPFTLCHNIIFYLWKLIWPVNLSSHYPFPRPFTLEDPAIFAGVIGTTFLMIVLLVSLRWTRALVIGWLFFFLALLPTTGIIGFTNVIASDKYAYLPIVGLLLPPAFYLSKLWGHRGDESAMQKRRSTILAVTMLLALAEVAATRNQLHYWQDTDNLYARMMALAPKAAVVRYNRAIALANSNRIADAMALYRETLAIDPDYAPAHNNLGMLLADRGDTEGAMKHYEMALANQEDSAETHNNIAILLLKSGKIDDAIAHCRLAIKYKYKFPEAHHNLAAALSKKGGFAEAIRSYEEALRLKPDYPNAHYNLANLLSGHDQEQPAVDHFLAAIKLNPNYAEAHNELGVILARRGQLAEAESHYREAKQIKPAWLDPQYNLAMALTMQNKLDDAIALYQDILRTNPQETDARTSLEELLRRKGQKPEAK